MDLLTGWDFSRECGQAQGIGVHQKVQTEAGHRQPDVHDVQQLATTFTFECNEANDMQDDRNHLQRQVNNGRWFLHEHPAGARSWNPTIMKQLSEKQDILLVIADQCRPR